MPLYALSAPRGKSIVRRALPFPPAGRPNSIATWPGPVPTASRSRARAHGRLLSARDKSEKREQPRKSFATRGRKFVRVPRRESTSRGRRVAPSGGRREKRRGSAEQRAHRPTRARRGWHPPPPGAYPPTLRLPILQSSPARSSRELLSIYLYRRLDRSAISLRLSRSPAAGDSMRRRNWSGDAARGRVALARVLEVSVTSTGCDRKRGWLQRPHAPPAYTYYICGTPSSICWHTDCFLHVGQVGCLCIQWTVSDMGILCLFIISGHWLREDLIFSMLAFFFFFEWLYFVNKILRNVFFIKIFIFSIQLYRIISSFF